MRWHTRGSGEGRVDGKMKKQVFDDIRLGSVPSYRMIRVWTHWIRSKTYGDKRVARMESVCF